MPKPKIGGGGPPAPPAPPQPGSQEWLKMYGHLVGYTPPGDAPGAADAAPGGAPTDFTNTVQMDPRLQQHLDRLDKRMDDPMGSTGRAIEMAGSKIRDANEGRRAALKGSLARRGVLGSSSIPELSEAALNDAEGRDINAAAAGISLQRERDNDAFMLGATGAYGTAASLAQGDKRIGLDQYLGSRGLDLQERQYQRNAQRSDLQDMMAILGSF